MGNTFKNSDQIVEFSLNDCKAKPEVLFGWNCIVLPRCAYDDFVIKSIPEGNRHFNTDLLEHAITAVHVEKYWICRRYEFGAWPDGFMREWVKEKFAVRRRFEDDPKFNEMPKNIQEVFVQHV